MKNVTKIDIFSYLDNDQCQLAATYSRNVFNNAHRSLEKVVQQRTISVAYDEYFLTALEAFEWRERNCNL